MVNLDNEIDKLRKKQEQKEPPQLSKKTISALIQKEAELIREQNPLIAQSRKEMEDAHKPMGEPIKLTPEEISELIKVWSEEGFTPKVIADMKYHSKKEKSDYTFAELKQFVKMELAQQAKIEKEKNAEEKLKIKTFSIRAKYLELIYDEKFDEASELLVDYILKNYYIYTTKDDNKPEIWIYKEGIYVPQGESEIHKSLRIILGSAYNIPRARAVLDKLKPDTFIDSTKFFHTNYKEEIPLLNGILNIKTKELSKYNPQKIFFNKLPVEYKPEAKCEKIEEFLKAVLLNEEDVKVFYELGGFCLLKEYTFEKAFMFVGFGRNGKGKSLELLKRLVGAENCYSLPLSALESQNPDVHQLFGKMINLAGDIGSTDLKDTSMFKALTGRDLITSKRKYFNAITFENYAKFVFACNELPMVYDVSKGFWDRWVLLDFPYYFADKNEYAETPNKEGWKLRDEDIINKIVTPEELSGLLNKCLEGLDRLLIQRKFSSTLGSDAVKNTWIRKSNSFMAFCIDCLEEDYDGVMTKKSLRKEYLKYCKQHKVAGKSDFVIKRVLQEMFGATDDRENMIGGTYEYVWKGIKFKKC